MDAPPDTFTEAVSREVSGERVLWVASPDPWGYARSYWKSALLGIPFAAFSIFWTYQASHNPTGRGTQGFGIFFPLWGAMFICFGLSIVALAFLGGLGGTARLLRGNRSPRAYFRQKIHA